jgi:hypothetical protein
MWCVTRKAPPPVTVRMWNDWYPYKKAYVIQGFYELGLKREVHLDLVDYGELERAGAPAPSMDAYNSHKNMVVFQIRLGRGRTVNAVYDCNDLYYKIPNALLNWADLYFKSNYQPEYLRTGHRLKGSYWDSLHFRAECLPEPLDVKETHKCRPCSFSMLLTDSPERNRRYLRKLEGAWRRTSPGRKRHDVFYLGSYWGPRRRLMDALVDQLEREDIRWLGGLVEAGSPLPAAMVKYRHESVGQEQWGKMAAAARLPLMERGLDGCVSYKPAHYCLIGAPFAAMEFLSNFWTPMRAGTNYFRVDDDFGNVGELIRGVSDDQLAEMGDRNLAFWHEVLCPEATARYILREAMRA